MANEMAVQKTESLSNSEAFTNKVLKEFGSNVAGNIQVTDYQRQLIQGYFIATDRALKMAGSFRPPPRGASCPTGCCGSSPPWPGRPTRATTGVSAWSFWP